VGKLNGEAFPSGTPEATVRGHQGGIGHDCSVRRELRVNVREVERADRKRQGARAKGRSVH